MGTQLAIHDSVPGWDNSSLFIQNLDNIEESVVELTSTSGYTGGHDLIYTIGNPTGYVINPRDTTIYDSNKISIVGGGSTLEFKLESSPVIIRDFHTKIWVGGMRYRFEANLEVSVGQEALCPSCQSPDTIFDQVLTPMSVYLKLDGHRDDVFISEYREIGLPLYSCEDCEEYFYHLLFIKEYV